MKKMKHLSANTTAVGKPARQKGAVLIFCLVFLAVLTMMGVSGMESTVLEERMSSNMHDYNLAIQSAESALKNAESWIAQQATLPTTSVDGTTTVWAENSMDPLATDGLFWWDHANITAAWWTSNADALSGVSEVAEQPSYIIEQYRTVDSGQSIAIGSGENTVPRIFHRITARGVGINASTEVKLQSTFVQTYFNN